MRLALVALLAAFTAAGCSGGSTETPTTSGAPAPSVPTPGEAGFSRPALEPAPDGFVVGAVDDAARHPGPVLGQLAAVGFGALGITSYWEPGLAAPTTEERAVLRDVAARAARRDLRIFLAVFHRGSKTTPLTVDERAAFSAYVAAILRAVPEIRDVIVGNEPNLNRFWLPQFGENGENLAAIFYLALLAEVYDAAKAAAPNARIWGGALAPRGVDRPNTGRDTHSPTTFIRDLGAELRRSGRTRPVLDGFAFHPYPVASNIPPDRPHPGSRTLGLADHERLRRLLREAFGSDLPILYSEFGVETVIPPAKAALYEGTEPGRPVDEATQADFYRRALELASCQEGVAGMLLFHSHDEPFLAGFQSGVHYVDGTRKESFAPVREAVLRARSGC
ncbi:MAG: hypothetical protein H0W14_00385 [Actinobacteria bacterium]|nr:hypothetical protein [Actinomycetota bacterium]